MPAGGEVRTIGRELEARADEVNARIVARSRRSGVALGADVEERLSRVGVVSTVAVARWMAGGGLDAAREVGAEAWQIFGTLAVERAAPLNEVTKRCLRWCDSASETVEEIAEQLGFSRDVVLEAQAMLRRSLNVTLVRMCETFEDVRRQVDEQLDRRQEELMYLATHDPLTGLANRAMILERTEQMMARSRRANTPVAALFIDLDNFKGINDTLGHDTGDELLRAVAGRLDTVVRATDVLGRLGGDEFVVVAEGHSLRGGADQIARRMIDALRAPFELGEDSARVTVTASVGIAEGHRASPDELLRDADIAMFQAKRDGKDRVVAFEREMHDNVQTRVQLEMDLRIAQRNDELFLVYQPTLALRDLRPKGVEALLRWRHPVRGLVAPDEFVPLLEETGMIVEIGRWVLREACAQAAAWHAAGHPVTMAVNVSARQLEDEAFVADVRETLATTGLDPQTLTIEITETALMRKPEATARILHEIKRLGIRVAIDDFGTGYSSLAHLRQFPVDALKIDRSFVSGLAGHPERETLVRTLVQLGKALAIETFAEGIENEAELSFLQGEECDTGQGFLFARPLTAQDFQRFLTTWAVSAQSAAGR
ncbi:MAG TPA: EAL domain-containing protein [Solirubrobacteraceae bacterium]|nr:EAL domain-containing protein [Solirubrobacteraceae bacterium]